MECRFQRTIAGYFWTLLYLDAASISRFGALLGDRHTCIHICFLEYYSILTFLMLCNKYVLRLLFKMSGGKNLEPFISLYKLNNLLYLINVVRKLILNLSLILRYKAQQDTNKEREWWQWQRVARWRLKAAP